MAETGGILSSQNAADVATETAPSPYWINDDDQVRAWIVSHSRADIARLSTRNKINAMKTLQSGWVSEDDVEAVAAICGCVGSTIEANAIRRAIDPLAFTDIGQRS
jgi:hypothetical protein